jgi:hypothetical protein
VPRILKDCFGTVISSLNKMKECVRCELLSQCQAINWAAADSGAPPVVLRRPIEAPSDGADAAAPGASKDPAAASGS